MWVVMDVGGENNILLSHMIQVLINQYELDKQVDPLTWP